MLSGVVPLTFLLATFLQLSLAFPQSEVESLSAIPSLVKQPEKVYYVGKRAPARLECQARDASEIMFTCGGITIPPTSVENKDPFEDSGFKPENAGFIIRASIQVTRADVQLYRKQQKATLAEGEEPEPYWCQCTAIDMNDTPVETSVKSYIHVAHLRRNWTRQPRDTIASAGETTEIMCGAPHGVPKPEIVWRKNSQRLHVASDDRLFITDHGSLVIDDVRAEDAGIYRCVARNSAGKRESEEAELSVLDLAESAEPAVEISDENGRRVETIKSRTPRQTAPKQRKFKRQPKPVYYVTPGGTVKIECASVDFDVLTMNCNGERREKGAVLSKFPLNDSTTYIKAELTIHYDEVAAYRGEEDFQCICKGWWVIKDEHWDGMEASPQNGKIIIAYMDDTFKKGPSDMIVQAGKDAEISCEAPNAAPEPHVSWYKDGQRIDLRRRREKYIKTSTNSLYVRYPQAEDQGSYSCEAKSQYFTKKSKPGYLTVTDGPVPTTTTTASPGPRFPAEIPRNATFLQDFPRKTVLREGESVNLTCVMIAVQRGTLKCGEKRLADDQFHPLVKVHEETNTRMVIQSVEVTAAQVADYSRDFYCQCTGWVYDPAANNWVSLSGTKGFVELENSNKQVFLDRYFKRRPRPARVMYGTTATLDCSPPDGYPTPTVSWMKDGEMLDTGDSRFTQTEQGQLQIRDVKGEDDGQYVCVAKNQKGEIKSRPAQLTVEGIPEPTEAVSTTMEMTTSATAGPIESGVTEDPTDEYELDMPVFVSQPMARMFIKGNEPVTLECKAIGTRQVSFFCNEQDFRETLSNQGVIFDRRTKKPIATSRLMVTREMVSAHKATSSTPFTCECVALYNEAGSQELSGVESSNTIIEIAYLKRRFVHEPETTTPVLGEEVKLMCSPPPGVPKPRVYWQKNKSPVTLSSRIELEASGNLVIKDFREADQGNYVCVAENMMHTRKSQQAAVYLTLVVDPTSNTGSEGVVINQDNFHQPLFTEQLYNQYYFTVEKSAVARCKAEYVESLRVECNEREIPESMGTVTMKEVEIEMPDGTVHMKPLAEANFEISNDDVAADLDDDVVGRYTCVCIGKVRAVGSNRMEEMHSHIASFQQAHLDDQFGAIDLNVTANETLLHQLNCKPPQGVPTPEVEWFKVGGLDGRRVTLIPTGILVINEVSKSDAGEYYCVVKNNAGMRTSQTITLNVLTKEGRFIAGAEGMEKATGGEDGSDPEEEMKEKMEVVEEAEQGESDSSDAGDAEPEATPEVHTELQETTEAAETAETAEPEGSDATLPTRVDGSNTGEEEPRVTPAVGEEGTPNPGVQDVSDPEGGFVAPEGDGEPTPEAGVVFVPGSEGGSSTEEGDVPTPETGVIYIPESEGGPTAEAEGDATPETGGVLVSGSEGKPTTGDVVAVVSGGEDRPTHEPGVVSISEGESYPTPEGEGTSVSGGNIFVIPHGGAEPTAEEDAVNVAEGQAETNTVREISSNVVPTPGGVLVVGSETEGWATPEGGENVDGSGPGVSVAGSDNDGDDAGNASAEKTGDGSSDDGENVSAEKTGDEDGDDAGNASAEETGDGSSDDAGNASAEKTGDDGSEENEETLGKGADMDDSVDMKGQMQDCPTKFKECSGKSSQQTCSHIEDFLDCVATFNEHCADFDPTKSGILIDAAMDSEEAYNNMGCQGGEVQETTPDSGIPQTDSGATGSGDEGGAAATKQDGSDRDGSSVAGVSVLLTVALQILVAAILSQR